jgi:hypothetical protein
LDFLQNLYAALEGRIGLGPIAESLVDLPEKTVGRSYL